MKKLLIVLTALWLLLPVVATAQKIGSTATINTAKGLKKVAMLPLMFRERDKDDSEECTNTTAIDSYQKILTGVFEKLGIEVVDVSQTNAMWREITGQLFETKEFQLPRAEDLVALGKRLGVDYILTSRCLWQVRTIWVGLGPKTKANATVDIWLVDVANSEFLLKADTVKADDTEREPMWKTGVTLFVAPISVVSAGPKTPHMQRAGTTALEKALLPWVEQQQANVKIKSGG